MTTSGTVAASDDTAAAPAIDPALGSGGYRSAAAWDPSGPVGQLIAKYGINKGTYIELGPPAAVAGRGASAEELKILAGSGAFGSPGTYQGLDYSYFSGVSGTTGVDKLADGTPVAAGMCVWTVWKNGEIVHQEVGSPNMDSTQLSIKYLGYA